MTDEIERFCHARERVLGEIAAAAGRARRDPEGVTLVAVSKTVAADRVRAAVAAGLTTLGENRVQEADEKKPLVPGAVWHLIGPLQSNKARRALETFSVIESVHSLELAQRLQTVCAQTLGIQSFPVLLQVNVDRDPAKAGFDPEQLEAAAETLDGLDRLAIRGLMTIGRAVSRAEDARSTFVALRRLSESLRRRWSRLGPDLSMGMSEDYPVAVEEGASIVRVGRALFGERPAP